MVKKYSQFVNESDNPNRFTDVKSELKSMIESTIDKSGGEFESFVNSFVKNPEDVKIEGLINDSDIYDFYLKWRNDIDEILNEVKYFDEVPSGINIFGLYDYVIKGTQKSIMEFVRQFSKN